MDNIKKFEDFLDRMQGLLDSAKKQGHIIVRVEDLENTFPELKEKEKESEDEKIRNVLVDYFKSYKEQEECGIKTFYGIPTDNIIAWLEKQGEHAKFCDSIQVGDKVTRNEDGVLVNLSQLNRVAKKDEKQGEQKPAEWSDEDEYCIHQLIVFCENCMIPDSGAKRCTHWLKSLKGRVGCEANCTTTKEWSEDDQSNFNELSSFILEIYRAEDASRLLIWFKSLKERVQPDKGWIPIKESFYTNNVVLAQKKDKSDVWEGYTVIADHTLDPLVFERYINIENISTQPLWKPSEAQMKWLHDAIESTQYEPRKQALISLYSDLMKLREE